MPFDDMEVEDQLDAEMRARIQAHARRTADLARSSHQPDCRTYSQRPTTPPGRFVPLGGYGGMAAQTVQEAPDRLPGLTEADILIHNGVDRLADALAVLEVRLQEILRPGIQGGAKAPGPGQPMPLRAPLAERLHAAAERIEGMGRAVESILGRLEV